MRAIPWLICLIIVSCGGSGGGSDSSDREESAGVTLESSMSSSEKSGFNTSLEKMRSLVINGANIRSFSQIFGGTSSANVVSFFDIRVNYVLSSSTNPEDNIVINAFYAEPVTLASNISLPLWFVAKANEPNQVRYEFNGQLLSIPSSRIGIIQIGRDYPSLNQILQVSALVHEARHSDCTGGALASDIERFQQNLPPLNNACGHSHVLCPPGHPYEGVFACDSHPWGAYVVGGIYSGAIALECSSCTESEKTVAEAIAIDSLSRPLYDVNALLDGAFGPPDMSSSNQVR